MEKALHQFRNKLFRYGGWNFFIDKNGNVHTSMRDDWDRIHLNGRGENHNHWLDDAFYRDAVLIKSFPLYMENK